MAQREELILDVTAQLDQARRDIEALQAQLDALAQPTEVSVAAQVEGLEEVDALAESTAELDGTSAEVELEADDEATDAIEDVEDAAGDLDGTTVEVEVEADTEEATSGLEGVTESLDGLGLSVGKLAGPAGLAALAGAFTSAASSAFEFTNQVEDLQLFTGDTLENSSRLLAVLQDFTDIDASQLEASIGRVADKFAAMPQLAEQLGINVAEARGPLDLFVQTIDALNSGQLSATERITLGIDIFGRRGVKAANEIAGALEGPLADAMAGISEERIISDADLAASNELEASLGELNDQLAAMAQKLGEQLIPLMTELAEVGAPAVAGLTNLFTSMLNQFGPAIKFLENSKFLLGQMRGESEKGAPAAQEWLDAMKEMGQLDIVQLPKSMDQMNNAMSENGRLVGLTAGLWKTLIADVRDGHIATNEAATAWRTLQEMLKLSDTEMAALVGRKVSEELAAEEKAIQGIVDGFALAQEAARDAQQAVADLSDTIGDINVDDLDNISRGFEEALAASDDFIGHLKFAEDFQHEFNDALGEARKFGPDLQELLELQAAGVTITPDITLGELESDDAEFLAWVQSLQNMVKSGAVEAFETGGTDAANAFVQAQAAALAETTGLPIAEVYRLMGLPPDGNLGVFIQPQIDAEAKADALSILDGIIGVDPNNPILAFLRLQVQTGAIDPVIAEIAALLLAQKYGVDVTPQLAEFTPEQIAAAEAALADTPVEVPVNVTDNGTAATTGESIQAVAEKPYAATVDAAAETAAAAGELLDFAAEPRFANIKAVAQVAEAEFLLGKGAQGVSRDRRAIIVADAATHFAEHELDDVANPGGLPRTAHINVQVHGANAASSTINTIPGQNATAVPAGITGLAAPTVAATAAVSAVTMTPYVAPAAAPINVTINAGVLGNHFDVERTVARALRRHQRVNGRR